MQSLMGTVVTDFLTFCTFSVQLAIYTVNLEHLALSQDSSRPLSNSCWGGNRRRNVSPVSRGESI